MCTSRALEQTVYLPSVVINTFSLLLILYFAEPLAAAAHYMNFWFLNDMELGWWWGGALLCGSNKG